MNSFYQYAHLANFYKYLTSYVWKRKVKLNGS